MVPGKYIYPFSVYFTVSLYKHSLCKLESRTGKIHSMVGDSNHLTDCLGKAVCRVEHHHDVLCMRSESSVDLLPERVDSPGVQSREGLVEYPNFGLVPYATDNT